MPVNLAESSFLRWRTAQRAARQIQTRLTVAGRLRQASLAERDFAALHGELQRVLQEASDALDQCIRQSRRIRQSAFQPAFDR